MAEQDIKTTSNFIDSMIGDISENSESFEPVSSLPSWVESENIGCTLIPEEVIDRLHSSWDLDNNWVYDLSN